MNGSCGDADPPDSGKTDEKLTGALSDQVIDASTSDQSSAKWQARLQLMIFHVILRWPINKRQLPIRRKSL